MSRMVTDREGFAAFLLRMRARGINNPALMAAIEATPRRSFVQLENHLAAWSCRMAPIACGEAIEGLDLQAQVIDRLELQPTHRVLEIGTGSGYTAALMARLARRVYTIERFRTLATEAADRHAELGIENVIIRHGDGSRGSAEGPFDRIVCWAAFDALPRHFVDHVVSGGVMVAPIGPADGPQAFATLTKVGSRFEREDFATARLQALAGRIAMHL